MSLEIKTNSIKPRRHTFAHVARRLGEDRPASRYEEATYDFQCDENYQYRPIWAPNRELFDKSLTAITMEDWYALKDPRQFYYGTYTIGRSRMIEAVDKNFAFAEKRNLLNACDPDWQDMVRFYLLPLRHMEWAGNMNACNITDLGWGAAITQPTMFIAMDRLGMAQIISRIGLAMGGPEALAQSKDVWMQAAEWQPLRKLAEDSLVIDDWFEQLLAQHLCIDGIIFPLVYEAFDAIGLQRGASAISMLSEFMVDWAQETNKWLDAVIKRAAAETPDNAAQLARWFSQWEAEAAEAVTPLARKVLGDAADEALSEIRANLKKRAEKMGLRLTEEVAA